ncbi:MAG: hypothetical protein H6970_15025 [Gammaproteobacteria bacterium]|nr:hypothetical protein [Gammaproteobacteria bacterium]MCP5458286.1 hypothetical protein [Gammaproteobacteria bacterium]
MQVKRQILDVTSCQVIIDLPESFVNHRVELIALTLDDVDTAPKRRKPHPEIAGKGHTHGDLIGPLVAEDDWECLN